MSRPGEGLGHGPGAPKRRKNIEKIWFLPLLAGYPSLVIDSWQHINLGLGLVGEARDPPCAVQWPQQRSCPEP